MSGESTLTVEQIVEAMVFLRNRAPSNPVEIISINPGPPEQAGRIDFDFRFPKQKFEPDPIARSLRRAGFWDSTAKENGQ